MTSETLLIEHGAIETRAALVRNSDVVRFWFGPAPGAEGWDLRPIEGRSFSGRVRHVDGALNAAFVDIGAAQDAFLPVRKTKTGQMTEGAAVHVRVVAAPRRSKGAVVELIGVAEAGSPPGRLDPASAPIEALETIGGNATDIVTDSAMVKQNLGQKGVDARMARGDEAPGLFAAYDADQAVDAALNERVALLGGGALHFSETEALVAIDVDTGATGAASADRLREKTIAEAVREAMLQIERRNLAGRIVIDFPSIRSRDVRRRAVTKIEKAISTLPRVTSTSIASSNFTTLIRERRGASLWDETTEPAPNDPVAGRRFSLLWLARCAVRQTERQQGATPGARPVIRVGKALHDCLQDMDNLADAYFERWGVRLDIMREDQFGDRDFEIIER